MTNSESLITVVYEKPLGGKNWKIKQPAATGPILLMPPGSNKLADDENDEDKEESEDDEDDENGGTTWRWPSAIKHVEHVCFSVLVDG